MSAMERSFAAVSMVAGLSLLAGCSADAPMVASAPRSGPMDAPAMEPMPMATAAPEPAMPGQGSVGRADKAMDEAPRKDRPGLGTEWGETRASGISHVSFDRADRGSPFASFALFYNDRSGANAMASAHRAASDVFTIAGGLVSVELRDEASRRLSGFVSAGKSYVVGEAGQRYSIVLRNRTDFRFEVVLSVDGLDVMDGKRASFEKRGYILDARGELEVDGFRQSTETVAAFRFGSVANSYAEKKHGESRNVGVIGVALFHELGAPQPVWSPEEIRRRRSANPFPGTFATPPGE